MWIPEVHHVIIFAAFPLWRFHWIYIASRHCWHQWSSGVSRIHMCVVWHPVSGSGILSVEVAVSWTILQEMHDKDNILITNDIIKTLTLCSVPRKLWVVHSTCILTSLAVSCYVYWNVVSLMFKGREKGCGIKACVSTVEALSSGDESVLIREVVR